VRRCRRLVRRRVRGGRGRRRSRCVDRRRGRGRRRLCAGRSHRRRRGLRLRCRLGRCGRRCGRSRRLAEHLRDPDLPVVGHRDADADLGERRRQDLAAVRRRVHERLVDLLDGGPTADVLADGVPVLDLVSEAGVVVEVLLRSHALGMPASHCGQIASLGVRGTAGRGTLPMNRVGELTLHRRVGPGDRGCPQRDQHADSDHPAHRRLHSRWFAGLGMIPFRKGRQVPLGRSLGSAAPASPLTP